MFQVMDQLEEIWFANNKLSGSIGDSLTKLSKLKVLDFSGNAEMRGVLPTELGELTALTKVMRSTAGELS